MSALAIVFFFSSRRRHTRCGRDWSSDVCSSDLKNRTKPSDRSLLQEENLKVSASPRHLTVLKRELGPGMETTINSSPSGMQHGHAVAKAEYGRNRRSCHTREASGDFLEGC